MKLRIAHFQCRCAPRDFDANLATLLRGLEQAADAHVDVVSFPETFLDGCFLEPEPMRAHAHAPGSPRLAELLARTRRFPSTFIVGFFRRDGDAILNSAAVIERGAIVGVYDKAFPCTRHETPGRRFEPFTRNGVRFGVVICADTGYIEPTRIQALKGAEIVFAIHYNHIPTGDVAQHLVMSRGHHGARASENGIWFVRGNNLGAGVDAGTGALGTGYGDSAILDPNGEAVARAGLDRECLLSADIDTAQRFYSARYPYSLRSARELGALLVEAAARAPAAAAIA